MAANREKDILKSIKQSVEDETPNVWEEIQTSEKYKYDFYEKPLKAKTKKRYAPAMAAAVLCAVVALAGIKMKLFELPRQNNDLVARTEAPEDSKSGTSLIFEPITKDADVKEASKAFGINVVEPSWMPQGFKKVSAKLYSNDKAGKQPYMYNIEYKNGNTLFAVTVMKNQPAPMPIDKGDASKAASSNAASSGAADMPKLPPDAAVQSAQSNNTIEPSPPSTNAGKASDTPASMPAKQGGITGGGSAGSAGSAPGSEPVSAQFTNIKIKNIEVSMTVVDSKENGALSAVWLYEGGSYSIYTDGVSKEDMVKIIESMIK
jgi:hypothetical protein